MTEPLLTYSALDDAEINKAKAALETRLSALASSETSEDSELGEIPPAADLVGIPASLYQQIHNALLSGKRHIMFYGPPGTGKTTLAQHVARSLHHEYKLVTGSADWTSQDIIGGYQPTADGKIRFVPGVLLEHFDKPLIVDELNRCDIDKVLGPLFTVLSGQPTTLPYQVDPGSAGSPRFAILPVAKAGAEKYEFAPTDDWRLIATINSIDKASLYQMSYALMRRFAWILVDAPHDIDGFIRDFVKVKNLGTVPEGGLSPLGHIWQAVQLVRPLGAAPFIDIINYCLATDDAFTLFGPTGAEATATYLEALSCFLFPMLDGILLGQATDLASKITGTLGLEPASTAAQALARNLSALAV